MKKLLIVGGTILFVAIIGVIFYFQKQGSFDDPQLKNMSFCTGEKFERIDCKKCLKNGGQVFEPIGFSRENICEIKARDAGKSCIYNDECDKKNCVYENEQSTSGKCDDYAASAARRLQQCNRPPSSEKVTCGADMS